MEFKKDGNFYGIALSPAPVVFMRSASVVAAGQSSALPANF
jgi:hypothetical protein